MHEQVDQLHTASINQSQGFETLFKYLNDQQNLLASTPAVRPCQGWTTSRFGYRKSPFTGRREFHKGLDIANRIDSPIIATADGVIAYSGAKGLFGKMVAIDHGHGMVTRFGHINKILVKRGQAVKRGDIIALMGNTGRSTGPHVHYEIHLNGIPVNPEKYILN
jgi:murein DD-endopeptidase MepM/ murein hydrolase activator NlpD